MSASTRRRPRVRVPRSAHGGSVAGSSRDSAALAISPMRARKSVPMSAVKRVGSGEAEHQQAEGRPALRARARSGISASDMRLAASSSQLHRLEAGVDAAVRLRQAGGEALRRRRSRRCANG